MRCLFFTNTPAHVHMFKYAVRRLESNGHDVLVLGRDYGCTVDLLEYFDLPHEIYGVCATEKVSLVRNVPVHYYNILRAAHRFDPDLVFGIGAYAAHSSALLNARCVLVTDSEPTLDLTISKPFADVILTPEAFTKDLGGKHYEFEGFKESAYLHPDLYEPDPTVREELGVEPDEPFVITRFNAFGSHHDVGRDGFSAERKRELLNRLGEHATVFVSDESGTLSLSEVEARPFDLHPARLHDALAEAQLLVADTQTMVTEAALLGTPAIRSNSFVGDEDMGNFLELEEAGLIFNHRSFDQVLETATDLLTDDDAKSRWRDRRDAYVDGTVNLTDVIVDVAESEARMDRVGRVSPRARLSRA